MFAREKRSLHLQFDNAFFILFTSRENTLIVALNKAFYFVFIWRMFLNNLVSKRTPKPTECVTDLD